MTRQLTEHLDSAGTSVQRDFYVGGLCITLLQSPVYLVEARIDAPDPGQTVPDREAVRKILASGGIFEVDRPVAHRSSHWELTVVGNFAWLRTLLTYSVAYPGERCVEKEVRRSLYPGREESEEIKADSPRITIHRKEFDLGSGVIAVAKSFDFIPEAAVIARTDGHMEQSDISSLEVVVDGQAAVIRRNGIALLAWRPSKLPEVEDQLPFVLLTADRLARLAMEKRHGVTLADSFKDS